MVPSHDIFKIDRDGNVIWRGAVKSFLAAKMRIQKLAPSLPSEYPIFDQNTGQSVVVMLLGVSTQAGSIADAGEHR